MNLSRDVYVPQIATGTTSGDETTRARPTVSLRRALAAWVMTLAFALSLLLLIIAAPLAANANHPSVAFTFYRAFAFACHQIPERSFHFHGAPFAVCARCWGIYAGFAAGVALYPLLGSLTHAVIPARRWLVIAALPTSVDFLLGFLGVWENTHLSRSLTGALFGACVAFFVVPGALEIGRSIRRAPSTVSAS